MNVPSCFRLHISRSLLLQEVAAQAEAKVLRLAVQFAPTPTAREQRRLDTIRLDVKHVRFCCRTGHVPPISLLVSSPLLSP